MRPQPPIAVEKRVDQFELRFSDRQLHEGIFFLAVCKYVSQFLMHGSPWVPR